MTAKKNVVVTSCGTMLDHVATLPKQACRGTFLADRSVRDRDWTHKSRSLGWDYSICIANNITITVLDGVIAAAECLGIKHNEHRYLPNVRVTLEADCTCNLAITWTRTTETCPANCASS